MQDNCTTSPHQLRCFARAQGRHVRDEAQRVKNTPRKHVAQTWHEPANVRGTSERT
jgi:hypothetical protein